MQELPGAGWLAATPLRARQRSLGVLVLHEGPSAEPSLDRELLEVLGQQVGTGIENVRLFAELRASSARAEVLRRITAAATSGSDLAAIVPAFAAELQALQAFDRLACGFVNDTGDYIEMVSHPEGTSWGLGSVLPVVGSGPGFVALNNRPVLQKDLVHEHRYLEDMRLLDEGLRSYALFPLSSRERAIGVLALGSCAGGAFDEGTLARLQPLADAVALAFENVRLYQKTRELSITDEVTPLHNFRYFHQALDRELKLVNRYGSTLSLLFVDLDRFKPINDQYGHLRGSRTLREVGFLIRAAVRETDIPARYGGDEFVVILPQTEGAPGPGARGEAAPPRRGPHLPPGGGDQRAARRLARGGHLPGGGDDQGGAHPPRRQADVRGQGVAEDGAVIESAGTLLYRRNDGKLEVLIVHPWGPYNRRAPVEHPEGPHEPRRGPRDGGAARDPGGDRGRGRVRSTRSAASTSPAAASASTASPAPPPRTRRPAATRRKWTRRSSWRIDRARFLLHPAQVTFLDRLLSTLDMEDAPSRGSRTSSD